MMGFDNNTIRVIKTVQELLGTDTDETEVTPFSINEAINRVLIMSPAWGKDLDRVAVTDELIRRFSVWVGEDATLVDNAGHVPWLVPSRKEEWRYWQRYREWQERKLPWAAVEGLDKSTDLILGNLEDPKRDGPWDRRGLVVGHVQSGKTGNYTGLICKAADAGYKMIIVLAGLHNNLRSQTQMRLDEGFLGYETGPIVGATKLIGVGNIDSSIGVRPHYATNRTNSGDFNAAFARSLGVSPEERPWLFVVKKNKSVLTRLLKWLRDHVANSQDTESGRKLINHLPLLVIDDEADHASVDTGEKIVGEDGRPDLQHQPTAINELVRKILHTFTRSAYVGYTATPFANIFIHEKGETAEEGPDLFPSAFISNLSAPSSYVGPARVFGLSTEDGREGGLPLSRIIGDQCSEHDERQGWMPIGHRSSFQPEEVSPYGVPASLAEAINSFILSCAVRNLRGQKNEHCSMLIHVTRFNQVQKIVRQQVSSYVSHVKERFARNIDKADILSDLHALWLKDFLPTSLALNKVMDEQVEIANWVEVSSELSSVLDAIDVRMINGTAKDALDYADSPAGIKVIAIGGDKLARGLTLEGLTVSYFLRASKMYDTLMQMGRWFGYRPGYLDLCRLYTTADLVDWFGHIADASEELREEFDYMVESGSRPIDYGLKVKSHSVLMVTSRLKMRSAKPLYLSFSGQVAETVAFFREPEVLERNLEAFQRLSSKLGSSTAIPIQQRNSRFESWSGVQWSNVKAEHIVAFLQEYETHPDSLKVNSTLLAAYIDKMSRHEELTEWTLAVMSGSSDRTYEVGGEITHLVVRTANNILPDRYSIGRLLSPKDEALDMGKDAWEAALDLTRKVWRSGESPRKAKVLPDAPSGSALRKVRGFGADGIKAHPERGLLIIYLLDPERLDENLLGAAPPIVSFAISFPGSNSKNKVEYMVNNVHWQNWEQQYGACD